MRFIDLIQSGLKGDDKCIFFGILFTFAIAFWKELYDKYVKKTFFDWWDIVAAFVPYPIVKFLNED